MTDEEPKDGPAQEPERADISAGFLPFGDPRQWIRMPGKVTTPRRRRHAPNRTLRVALPVLLLASLTAADRAGLFGGSDEPAPVVTPSPRPAGGVVALTGLAATRIGPGRVTITWDDPDPGEGFTYTIYRDGEPFATSTETTYSDESVEPRTFHYYAVTANGDLGTVAGSQQLLVAVPTKTGQLPTGSPPPPPPPPIPSASPSPVPSPSVSPSPSQSPTLAPSPSPSPSPSPTTSSPSPSPSPTATSPSASPSPTKAPSPSPSPTKTCERTCWPK